MAFFQYKNANLLLLTKLFFRQSDVSSNTIVFLRNSCGISQKQITVLLDTSSKDPLNSLNLTCTIVNTPCLNNLKKPQSLQTILHYYHSFLCLTRRTEKIKKQFSTFLYLVSKLSSSFFFHQEVHKLAVQNNIFPFFLVGGSPFFRSAFFRLL